MLPVTTRNIDIVTDNDYYHAAIEKRGSICTFARHYHFDAMILLG